MRRKRGRTPDQGSSTKGKGGSKKQGGIGAARKEPRQGDELIAPSVVDELVARNESEIDELRRRLNAALSEAEDAEARVASHRGTPLLPLHWHDPMEGRAGLPTVSSNGERPRTTVVTRPAFTNEASGSARRAARPKHARSKKRSKRPQV